MPFYRIVTCRVEGSLHFYRDVLGQIVASDDGGRPVTTRQKLIDRPADGTLRIVIFKGTGEYQGGPMIGSRIGLPGLQLRRRGTAATSVSPITERCTAA